MMRKAKILIADDHKIVADGLRNILEPEFEIMKTVENGRELLEAARELHPDVIIADISMPLLNGIDAVRQIKKENESSKVVFLTMHPDVTYASEAFDVGASGYVLKHSASLELVTAIHEVLKGRTYLTPMIAAELLMSYREGTHKRNDTLTKLSARQREVLKLLVEGKLAKEVGDILNISVRTVEFHKYKMMETLNIKTSAELVQYAIRHGIVSV
jgi:DNA-binding NarL/FixJ family response regulator